MRRIRRAFENELGCPVIVPEYNKVMGAFGAAVLAAVIRRAQKEEARPALHSAGLTLLLRASAPARFSARTAPNHCEVTETMSDGGRMGCLDDRCGKYQNAV